MILALFLPLALKEEAMGPLETTLKPEQPINWKDWMFKLRSLDAEGLSQREVTQLVATILLSLSFLSEQCSCRSALRDPFAVAFFLLSLPHQALRSSSIKAQTEFSVYFFFWLYLCREISSFSFFAFWIMNNHPSQARHVSPEFIPSYIFLWQKHSLWKVTQPHRRRGAQGTPVTERYGGGSEWVKTI